MAAALTDYFRKVGASTVTTLAAPGKALAASSINVGSTTNYPTDTGIVIAIRTVDSNGDLVAGTYTEWNAIVASGTSLTIATTPRYGSDQVYAAGSTTQVYIPVSSSAHEDLIDGISEFANQDGTLKTAPVQAALGVSTLPTGGWETLNSGTAPTVASGYNSGNRSFELTFSGVDLSSTLSNGMRVKFDRDTAAPTQCADLEEGSSQYASKSSPTGLSFTTTFSAEAWVKLESYPSVRGGIVARRNGDTEGWSFHINSSGQVNIHGLRVASNSKYIQSYQSVPLGKWVHIAATIDMSAGDTSAQKVWIDGVEVPSSYNLTGTATALVQGTSDLTVGANKSGGTELIDGKLADVRVWSDARTTTEIQDNMYGYPSDTTGLVAHFKLDGDFTDASSNGNDLTAQNSAVATDSDNPWNDTEYGVVTNVAYSSDTTVQIFCPIGYGIPLETLTDPNYSTVDTPYGFPRNKELWVVDSHLTYQLSRTITNLNDWYSMYWSIYIPQGEWEAGFEVVAHINTSSSAPQQGNFSLQVYNTDDDGTYADANRKFELNAHMIHNSATLDSLWTVSRTAPLTVSSITRYSSYIDIMLGTGTRIFRLRGDYGDCVLRARCAYI